MQGATLAVADQGVGATESFEHGGGVLAGEGAGLVNVGVLGTVSNLAASGQLFNQTQKDNRRADGDLHGRMSGSSRGQSFDQSFDRSFGAVQFPVTHYQVLSHLVYLLGI